MSLILWTHGARADTYEWNRLRQLLARSGFEPAEAPAGQTIAWVRVEREEVFVEDELWPTWFNIFHVLTRKEVIRRELLFAVNRPYDEERIEESMRNLRNMGIFALVRIVAVRTARPGQVGLVVYTRDLWSLRLEQEFNITTQIDLLLLRVTERNLAGRQKSIAADFLLVPKTYTLTESYAARRVWGSDVSFEQSASLTFNREHGHPEGRGWAGSVGKRYLNLRQRYAYDLQGAYSTRVERRLLKGETDTYTGQGALVANRVWREQRTSAAISGSIRRGERYKQSFGGAFSYRNLDAFAIDETQLPPALAADFAREVLPRQRREVGPAVSYGISIPTFHTFENLATFGQSENVRVGPYLDLSVRAPLRLLGSTSDSWVLGGLVGVVVAPGGGLVEARLTASTRYEGERVVDQLTTAMARGATPVFLRLRAVSRSVLELRRNDTARQLVALGASNGLRGYPSQSIYGYGASRLLQNVELRTLPIAWQAVHVGGVVFADVGSVFQRFRELRLQYAVGVGVRVFFPQFNRYPFSFDAGAGTDPPFRLIPTVAGGQLVPLTATEDALAN